MKGRMKLKIYLVNDNGTVECKQTASAHENELVDVTGLDPIVLSNVLELIKRSRVGFAKYGTTVYQNNKDDFLQHAKEEALDLANYLTKLQHQKQ